MPDSPSPDRFAPEPAGSGALPAGLPADPAKTAEAVAAGLLGIGAVDLRPGDPFTWSSGRRAPIYCDNRKTLAHPRLRRLLSAAFARTVAAHQLQPAVVAGTATAGIPHAAWLADRIDRPMAYVRSSAKKHGRGRRIEGADVDGRRVVLVEDLVSTGGSALNAVGALRAAGAEVPAVLAIFTYELDAAATAFAEADVPLHALSTFSALLQAAGDDLAERQRDVLRTWRDDPAAWSERHGGA
jgi:orotate phosphoribosyltransferase